MRVHPLPLSLALAVIGLASPSTCTASLTRTVSTTSPSPSVRWVRPRFEPPSQLPHGSCQAPRHRRRRLGGHARRQRRGRRRRRLGVGGRCRDHDVGTGPGDDDCSDHKCSACRIQHDDAGARRDDHLVESRSGADDERRAAGHDDPSYHDSG